MLYEMLTGRAAFTGETTSDILASVIRAEPDWSALPGSVPTRIRERSQARSHERIPSTFRSVLSTQFVASSLVKSLDFAVRRDRDILRGENEQDHKLLSED
jgi:hypothetical protein